MRLPLRVAVFMGARAPLLGCVACDSANAEVIRAGIFDASFFGTLAEVLTVVPILAVVIYISQRLLPD